MVKRKKVAHGAKKRVSLGIFGLPSDIYDDEESGDICPQMLQPTLLMKPGTEYNSFLPLPYDIMVMIFRESITISEYPMNQILKLSQVCEGWRRMMLENPPLWQRLDVTGMPITSRNVSVIKRVYEEFVGYESIKHFVLSGFISSVTSNILSFIEYIIKAPSLKTLEIKELRSNCPSKANGFIIELIGRVCKNLDTLIISNNKDFFNNVKWISEYLTQNGANLKTLDLSMSFNFIPPQLQKVICKECRYLKFLDLTTCDSILSNSFDAPLLASSLPELEFFRAGNVSFKQVTSPPTNYGLPKLKEISIPIGMRDVDRDDAILATLAYGSNSLRVLDIRGSSVSAQALICMPSDVVEELYMDDICPFMRRDYKNIIMKWSKTLKSLSLTKINCASTIGSCLKALIDDGNKCLVRQVNLSCSEVEGRDLLEFLRYAKELRSIDLTSCRSLPRGCKMVFKREPSSQTDLELKILESRLNYRVN